MEDKIDCLLDMIPQESHFYYYFRGSWTNGKEGSITDSNGHGVYRFYPLIRDENGNRIDAEIDFDDYDTNPVVAIGIVAYWLHYRKNNDRLASYTTWSKDEERKNTLKIFNDYTEDKLKQYVEREQYSPSSWRRDLEMEFYTDFIIRNEEPLNEQSKALFEYITKDDRKLVEEVIEEYMKYLKIKKAEYKKKKPRMNNELTSFVPTGQTFVKTSKITDMQLTLIMQRLSMANKLDPDCLADDWLKLFSGMDCSFTMKWLGTPGELRDLFKALTEPIKKGKTGYVTPNYNYQQIVLSHFVDKDGQPFSRLKGQKSIESFQPIIDDCIFTIQCMTERMTTVMKEIIREHRKELEEQGFIYNTTAAKMDDKQRVRNKL